MVHGIYGAAPNHQPIDRLVIMISYWSSNIPLDIMQNYNFQDVITRMDGLYCSQIIYFDDCIRFYPSGSI